MSEQEVPDVSKQEPEKGEQEPNENDLIKKYGGSNKYKYIQLKKYLHM